MRVIDCPICFEPIQSKPASTAKCSCGHGFCKPCMQIYMASVAKNLSAMTSGNPFVCPQVNCDCELTRPFVLEFLSPSKHMVEKFLEWEKDQVQPQATFLSVCPRKKCAAAKCMRYAYPENEDISLRNMVYCDACGATYCEKCLYRYDLPHPNHNAGKIGQHCCDGRPIRKLCMTYHGPQKLAKDDDFFFAKFQPWLPSYAAAYFTGMNDIALLLQWKEEAQAQFCPGCNVIVERNVGCNHMICLLCGQDFCYDCGAVYYNCECSY